MEIRYGYILIDNKVINVNYYWTLVLEFQSTRHHGSKIERIFWMFKHGLTFIRVGLDLRLKRFSEICVFGYISTMSLAPV